MPKPPRRKQEDPPLAPPPLKRAPRTDLAVHMGELDTAVFAAVEAVAQKLMDSLAGSSSLDQLRLLLTKAHMLLAMKSTHGSIRRLVSRDDANLDMAVDAFPLTRVQLERCFLGLLLEDNPDRWNKRYQKNAWKAFAKKYFRDQCSLAHLPPFRDYFGPSGAGIAMLRSFAREMYVWEDELQTLRVQIRSEQMDPRWNKRYIADMPTPARALGLLSDPTRKALAELLYPYYDSLSHFTHGGMVGVMQAALLRERDDADESAKAGRERFWYTNIMEGTLPASYVAQLFLATLFSLGFPDDAQLRERLVAAWTPYHCDGSPLGIGVWDAWAGEALGARSGEAAESDGS